MIDKKAMSQRKKMEASGAVGSLGGQLKARQHTWLGFAVPGTWHTAQSSEPGVRQTPGNSGFTRQKLSIVEREGQKQNNRESPGTKTIVLARSFTCAALQLKIQCRAGC